MNHHPPMLRRAERRRKQATLALIANLHTERRLARSDRRKSERRLAA